MSQLDITTVVAVVGAVTGVLALVLQLATYRRDRARVTVRVTSGFILSERTRQGPFVWVEAVNSGRRPIKVVNAGFLASGERFVTFGDLRTLPKLLNEGEEVKVSATLSSLVEQTVLAGKGMPTEGYVEDALGRRFTTSVPQKIRDQIADEAARARSESSG